MKETVTRPARVADGDRASARLLRRVLPIFWINRGPLLVSWMVLASIAALAPSVGWMGKTIVDAMQASDDGIVPVLLRHAWIFGLIFTALTLLEIADSPTAKWLDTRLVVTLQRGYLANRRNLKPSSDVAQMLFGSEEAKRGLRTLVDDVPRLVLTVLSVVFWQASLAPGWLPFMAASFLPALVWLILLSSRVETISRNVLDAQVNIAGATAPEAQRQLSQHQGSWLRASVLLEFMKGLGEKAMSWIMWVSFFAIIVTVDIAWPERSPAARLTVGEFMLTMINLKLFVDPLSSVGKIVNQWRQALPALRRALGLEADNQP